MLIAQKLVSHGMPSNERHCLPLLSVCDKCCTDFIRGKQRHQYNSTGDAGASVKLSDAVTGASVKLSSAVSCSSVMPHCSRQLPTHATTQSPCVFAAAAHGTCAAVQYPQSDQAAARPLLGPAAAELRQRAETATAGKRRGWREGRRGTDAD